MIATFRSFFLLLALAAATIAQTSLNYGFVSPNTKENLKIEDAIKGMRSVEETKLVRQSMNLSCVVGTPVRAFVSLGSWSDGAEHSVMIRVKSDTSTVRYLLSRLGRDAQQKSILYFHPQTTGNANLYTLKPRRPMRNLAALAQTLDRAGITFRTLVPVKSGTWIYVVDLKGELRKKVMTAAKRLRARVTAQAGAAAFVGDEKPDEAKVIFEEEIRNYEAKNPKLPPPCDSVDLKNPSNRTNRFLKRRGA